MALVAALFLPIGSLRSQGLSDPGFENYAVGSGGFVQPASGPWRFSNDAGVVEPYAPNSSTGPLQTWSATFTAMEGQQYASTYAALDSIRQTVHFETAGDYNISVYAAAPSGSVTIPTVGTLTLVNGEFTFILNNVAIGSRHTVPSGLSWALYTADFVIPAPGHYDLGVRNTGAAPYFINYDAFAIVPEPTTLHLALALGIVAVAGLAWRRRQEIRVGQGVPTNSNPDESHAGASAAILGLALSSHGRKSSTGCVQPT